MKFKEILQNLPEVTPPIEKKLSFNIKLKWTTIILVSFFILANIPLYGLSSNSLSRFWYLAVLLGADFGSLISLGIGPIVMSSIILQLLAGAKILDIDLHDPEGKKYFQGLQKLLTFAFIIFEAMVYVLMKGLQALPGMTFLVIFQLCLGGLLIVFMDEVIHKWGFGSGVSLFIVAGVASRLFSELFQFMTAEGSFGAVGQVLVLVSSIINGDPKGAEIALVTIIITIIIFLLVVWAQALKVEIPLAFDRIRGYGIKWPLQFFYASNIPVILVSALAANMQLFAGLLENIMGRPTFLGSFSNGVPVSGFAFWINSTSVLNLMIAGGFRYVYLLQSLGHILFYVIFSIVFAFFWVQTSGMDAQSQARNIISSGLQIPGFRKDERILETVLSRYVTPLTIMGGAAVGLLASIADILGAMAGGTSILLAVMILYQLYQNIAQQHAVDMHPSIKGMFGG
jgi:preprotein translocase subunit SecY